MSETIAIIKDVEFGNRDVGRPVLSFTTQFENGICALQVLEAKQALELIEISGVSNVKDLNGRMCWVEEDGMKITFIRLWNEYGFTNENLATSIETIR